MKIKMKDIIDNMTVIRNQVAIQIIMNGTEIENIDLVQIFLRNIL